MAFAVDVEEGKKAISNWLEAEGAEGEKFEEDVMAQTKLEGAVPLKTFFDDDKPLMRQPRKSVKEWRRIRFYVSNLY